MSRREHWSLLVVRSNGSRVFRINLPRRATVVGGALAVVLVAGLGVLVGDWITLRQITRETRADRVALGEQRRTLAAISQRLDDLSRDTEAWREMHARIWEALGPEPAARTPNAGIGGGLRPVAPRGERSAIDRLADSIAEEGESLRALDRLIGRAGKALASLPSRWPVRGSINSEFGRRLSPWTGGSEFHSGLDIGAKIGTPVHAPAAGTVVIAGDLGDHGIGVVIEHGEEIRTHYGHLSRVSVRKGQTVARGALVGYTGNTGRTTGPHLHYEVLVKGRPVNPRSFLWD
ncbi:MAG: M23 family metallopeptidase [Candidatus Rokubacteria bacterium]|nr:M23 family metallopeptidase [Candidatus Rokubacteria bacterium]